MKIRLRLFASVRDIVGDRELTLEVSQGIEASALLELVVSRYPRLHGLAPCLKMAVNQEYVDGGHVLIEGDEVALIPPVSGGVDRYEVAETPLSLDALCGSIGQPAAGAIASFLGIVRGVSRGRQVHYLEYDAYPEMAVAKMRQIGEELQEQVAGGSGGHRAPGGASWRRGGERGDRDQLAPPARGARGVCLRHRAPQGSRAHLEKRSLD